MEVRDQPPTYPEAVARKDVDRCLSVERINAAIIHVFQYARQGILQRRATGLNMFVDILTNNERCIAPLHQLNSIPVKTFQRTHGGCSYSDGCLSFQEMLDGVPVYGNVFGMHHVLCRVFMLDGEKRACTHV